MTPAIVPPVTAPMSMEEVASEGAMCIMIRIQNTGIEFHLDLLWHKKGFLMKYTYYIAKA